MIGWSSIWKNKARGPKKPAPSRYSNATPLAMRMCGHSQESANLGLQWHVISMYAPSFFNGSLIARMGAGRVAAMRLIMMGVLATIGLGGIAIMHFWWSLILLGVG